ncbi:MAG: glycoside hydrolase family 127 protein, partial [Lentisphaeria bacterium]|nr:glycoside hydrolase family 127 protein [Lentisphaeria bacterium]
WDVWGRKYVLLALIRYYNFIERDERIPLACSRLLSHLMTQLGPDGKDILDSGCHDGLASSSILDAVVETWRITREKKFLKFAEWIVSRGGSKKHNIFKAVLEGIPPCEIGNGKAYEMMSCFQGLAELYIETGKPEYLKAVKAFYEAVRDREIFITGVGGSKDSVGEFWNDTALRQLETDCGGFGETCVTVTWLHYCECVLRLTGDPKVADEIERSLYNGILGGVNVDGASWVHVNPTPLAGVSCKQSAPDQIGKCFKKPYDNHDCCRAQGPEGLAMSPYTAAFTRDDTLFINFYEDAEIEFDTLSGQTGKIRISGGYPASVNVRIAIQLPKTEHFKLALRIPAWSAATALYLNGKTVPAGSGKYSLIEREWGRSDNLVIRFDRNIRVLHDADRAAVLCGPLVMVQDRRFGKPDSVLHDLDFELAETPGSCLAALMNLHGQYLIDYASAGKPFDAENTLCIWMRTKKPAR